MSEGPTLSNNLFPLGDEEGEITFSTEEGVVSAFAPGTSHVVCDERGMKNQTRHTDITAPITVLHEPSFAGSSYDGFSECDENRRSGVLDEIKSLQENSISDYDDNSRSRVLNEIKSLEDELEVGNVLDRITKLEETVHKLARIQENEILHSRTFESGNNKNESSKEFCANISELLECLEKEVDQNDFEVNEFTKDNIVQSQSDSSSDEGIKKGHATNILGKIKKIHDKLRGKSSKIYDEDDDDEDEETLPEDCYSMIALNGPDGKRWPKQKKMFFLFGLNVFLFQFAFLFLMIWSRIDTDAGDTESDNPHDTIFKFIPSNSKYMIRAAQFISILAYTLFPESSLMEIIKAVRYFPTKDASTYDPNGFMRLSCILRAMQGSMATLAVFAVLITSDTVEAIVLNFTALNFISGLDDDAFSLAREGMFGKGLKQEAIRIENKERPPYVTKRSKFVVHWGVMGSTAAILFSLLAIVYVVQVFTTSWVTNTFRVGIREGKSQKNLSGCYGVNANPKIDQRRTYDHFEGRAAFGYCESESRWIFFEGSAADLDPCEAGEDEIAHSSETSDFDIASAFESAWFYPSSKIPINMFFESDGDNDDLYCDMDFGDGICNEPFNDPGYEFDYGDCCAASCTASHCGAGLTNAFGATNITDSIGFPTCKDPRMESITIQLNAIKSSRDEEFGMFPCALDAAKTEMDEWRAATPASPSLYLECDGRYVLSISIDKEMENHAETVKVEDGATCTLRISNSAHVFQSDSKTASWYKQSGTYCEEPIWFVNYTVLHGSQLGIDFDGLEILTQSSSEVENSYFKRIPECYLQKLKHRHDDLASLYDISHPSSKAIERLRNDTSGYSDCTNEFFVERFALSSIYFALKKNGTRTWIDTQSHCTWSGVECNSQGSVVELEVANDSLVGAIPSELSLLTNLEKLYLYENQITAIPSDIVSLSNLKTLFLHMNNFSSIPDEIVQMTNLEAFTFGVQNIGSMFLPSEIWQLSNLRYLSLTFSNLTMIPSEIGFLSNLEILELHSNFISTLPTELGLLKNLRAIKMNNNQLTSIPTEIGMMENLRTLWL
eukprot:CAMPEP_0116129926 /NCGR_PEP_ID=MMETSP0329-20121206/8184_1 /TAXON_ID=697910 /ORGANISM="Pseudo-nitzschia arenysensis, Strain B593" /LENGTH=1066 /DNA_ID=CAMNT_0003624225 /DNA_START=259 /DNA_END=3456 /DNA_ORIENTATION=+